MPKHAIEDGIVEEKPQKKQNVRCFPADPFHFRWNCDDTSVSWETNDRICDSCICYICNVTMSLCRVKSHRWAAPPSVTKWESKRNIPDTVPVTKGSFDSIEISGNAIKLATVSVPIQDLGSTYSTFGVPSSMVRTYMRTPCIDALWPMLSDSAHIKAQAYMSGHLDEYEAITEACNGAKANRSLVGKMSFVKKIEVDPRRNTMAILRLCRQGRGDVLQADLYIHRSVMCAPINNIIKMSKTRSLFSINSDDIVFPACSRTYFDHQKTSLVHMIHIEQHGLTDKIWTLCMDGERACLVNQFLGSAHLVTGPLDEATFPDKECTGGLLCNDRGTGKTLIVCALIAHQQAPAEWLEDTSGRAIDNTSSHTEETEDEEEDDEEEDNDHFRPWELRTDPSRPLALEPFEAELQSLDAASCPRVSTTLIILPSHNLLTQWKEELESVGVSVGIHHGNKKIDTIEKLTRYKAVLTTSLTLYKDMSSVFSQVRFWRVVVDEIHKVFATAKLGRQALAITMIRGKNRWGITATPDTNPAILRNYMRFLYGIPDAASSSLNHIHHYMRFPASYRSIHEFSINRVFLPAMTVQIQAALIRPPVHHHSVEVVPDKDWFQRYQTMYKKCKESARQVSSLVVQYMVNQMLMAVGGAKSMSDFKFAAKSDFPIKDSDVLVPPDIIDCSICLQEFTRPVVTKCNHFFCEECMSIWSRAQHVPRCPICRTNISHGSVRRCASMDPQATTSDDENDLPPCTTKIESIVNMIQDNLETDPTNRFLIFSRFPAVRKAIRERMGSLIVHTENITRFQNESHLSVLILSPNSCAVGLNLTQANHVILTEPSFKLSTEKQAYARADRIGQTREVHVHQFYVKGTIEENIIRRRSRNQREATVASYAFSS